MWQTGESKVNQQRVPNGGKGGKWWWLPGTLTAIASVARFAYEIFRDHFIR